MSKQSINMRTWKKILTKNLAFFFVIGALFVLPANAALQGTGPTGGANGFPIWYSDSNGLRLEPCLGNATGLADQFCVLPVLPPLEPNYDPALQINFPGNYPGEAFYWISDSEPVTVGAGGKAILRMALEGTFASADGSPTPGQQITFLRVNLKKMSGLTPNSEYKVTYPFGTFNFTTDAAGDTIITTAGQAFRTEDSSFIPGDFASLLPAPNTNIGPFLTWTGLPEGGLALDPANPDARYIGDGVTLHTITAGPNGAFFRIDGPNITGTGGNTIQTDLWTLAGRIAGGSANITGFKINDANGNGIQDTVEGIVPGWNITIRNETTGFNINVTTNATGIFQLLNIPPRIYTVTEEVKPGWINTTPTSQVITLADAATALVNFTNNLTANRGVIMVVDGASTSAGTTPPNINSTYLLTVTNVGHVQDTYNLIIQNPQNALASLNIPEITLNAGMSGTVILNVTGEKPGIFSVYVTATSQADPDVNTTVSTVTKISGLQAVGPTNVSNGFPLWYMDANGLPLEACLGNATGLADPLCVLPVLPPLEPNYDPALQINFPGNYPSEAFYWIADSEVMSVGPDAGGPNAGKAILRMALEGAFDSADGSPAPGKQITFLRVNLKKMSGLTPNSEYKVTYPFGTFNFTTDAAGDTIITTAGQAFRTEDSSFIPGDFASLLPAPNTNIGPFLTWTGLPEGGLALDPANPDARYIGDGVTLHTITAGPDGAFFRIDGPDIGGPGINTAQTDLWTVAGKIFAGSSNITGFKVNDTNSNGIVDPGEPGIQGWNISLRNTDVGLLKRTNTDASGFYNFLPLVPGNYTITEELRAGWTNTSPALMTINLIYGIDSNNNNFTNSLNTITSITVHPSTTTLTVGGSQEFNATVRDQSGNPMAGIDVSWTVSNSAVGSVTPITATTDSAGNASTIFQALAPGTVMINATNGSVYGTSLVNVDNVPQSMTVFARGADEGLWYRNWDGTSWNDWQSLGGLITDLDAKSGYVAVRSTDNSVWVRKRTGASAWGDWENLGGSVVTRPVIAPSGSSIFIFAVGSDNGVWTRKWDGSVWSDWQSLGGFASSEITATSSGSAVNIFARGSDNGVWTRKWDGSIWSDWQGLGGAITSDPESVSSAGQTYVFTRGEDNGVWTRKWDGSVWSDWQSLGGTVSSNISVSSSDTGNITIFVNGTDNGVWTRTWDGSVWSDWQGLGGSTASDPDSVSSSGQVHVFVRGGDDVWTQNRNGGVWSDWQGLGGPITSEPVVTSG